MKCTFCNQPPMDCTQPPLCAKHLDLAIMCEYLLDHKEPVTVENVQQLVHVCHARNGKLDLQLEDVEPMLTGEFMVRYAGEVMAEPMAS